MTQSCVQGAGRVTIVTPRQLVAVPKSKHGTCRQSADFCHGLLTPESDLPSPDLFAVGDYRFNKGAAAPADIRSGFAGNVLRTERWPEPR